MLATAARTELVQVHIIGGGPTGLLTALELAHQDRISRRLQITIHEQRWSALDNAQVGWAPNATRRPQVITLQNEVIRLLCPKVRALFQNANFVKTDHVWPDSFNIAIVNVEDALLGLIHREYSDIVLSIGAPNLDTLQADIIVGADGGGSRTRAHFGIETSSIGVDHALGVRFDIPDDAPATSQALNTAITVSNMRYLVNSLNGREGFLNIRVSVAEYQAVPDTVTLTELQKHAGQVNPDRFQSVLNRWQQDDHTSANAFICSTANQYMQLQSRALLVVVDGLMLYQIPSQYVTSIRRIPINMQWAATRFKIKDLVNRQVYVILVGDAAMQVNFWPGRGANSGFMAAVALSRSFSAIRANRKRNDQGVFFRPSDFIFFEAFMAGLKTREQEARSQYISLVPVDDTVDGLFEATAGRTGLQRQAPIHRGYMVDKINETIMRMNTEDRWPFTGIPLVNGQILNSLNVWTLQTLINLGTWPTREMHSHLTPPLLLETILPQVSTKIEPQPQSVEINRFRVLELDGYYDIASFLLNKPIPFSSLRSVLVEYCTGESIKEGQRVLAVSLEDQTNIYDFVGDQDFAERLILSGKYLVCVECMTERERCIAGRKVIIDTQFYHGWAWVSMGVSDPLPDNVAQLKEVLF
ncbi:hypothetical protein BC830DRAFT_1144353 [Chytriomyces sp. MP71]|nr:hypothetical protein BC830DRAFT_1144353 [Chytriomyces sp. MP71]